MVTSSCTRSSTAIAAIPLAGGAYSSAVSYEARFFDVLGSRVHYIKLGTRGYHTTTDGDANGTKRMGRDRRSHGRPRVAVAPVDQDHDGRRFHGHPLPFRH